jgi:hypothetical protein
MEARCATTVELWCVGGTARQPRNGGFWVQDSSLQSPGPCVFFWTTFWTIKTRFWTLGNFADGPKATPTSLRFPLVGVYAPLSSHLRIQSYPSEYPPKFLPVKLPSNPSPSTLAITIFESTIWKFPRD